eukprot:TRINITY_DN22192_c0_g2_i1.p1 TRINITY_DN22192_c0_g2~~TRINITY_DN22192_c0_g2_i1.p1  ORF type:complete len:212 (-),score=9.01 TRINITY_DN22192_c0_g2_i1:482-1030(-)
MSCVEDGVKVMGSSDVENLTRSLDRSIRACRSKLQKALPEAGPTDIASYVQAQGRRKEENRSLRPTMELWAAAQKPGCPSPSPPLPRQLHDADGDGVPVADVRSAADSQVTAFSQDSHSSASRLCMAGSSDDSLPLTPNAAQDVGVAASDWSAMNDMTPETRQAHIGVGNRRRIFLRWLCSN